MMTAVIPQNMLFCYFYFLLCEIIPASLGKLVKLKENNLSGTALSPLPINYIYCASLGCATFLIHKHVICAILSVFWLTMYA